jgi:hypothetical protein
MYAKIVYRINVAYTDSNQYIHLDIKNNPYDILYYFTSTVFFATLDLIPRHKNIL